MQTLPIRRSLAVLLCVCVFAACSRDDDPPILRATLRSVTLSSTSEAVGARLQDLGYQRATFAANYPGTTRVHALLWEVPEETVGKALEFTAPAKDPAHVRVLLVESTGERPTVSGAELTKFYRGVLGIDVPRFPADGELPEGVRVHAWTLAIPDVVEARNRLREANIPVVFSPVALTSPIFGDHKMLAIRAPDGVLVELIQATAN